MAQTTGAVTGAASTISAKINAGAYVDISGSTQSIHVLNIDTYHWVKLWIRLMVILHLPL
jgi:hypothetical protein